MEKNIRNTQLYSRLGKLFLGVVAAGCITLTSCQDDYDLDKKEPGWLGSSIYGYLEDAGNFKNLTRLIDDLDYKEVLNQTGSKTLFAASDEAFEEIYRSNEWGVTSYENFTVAQKNLLLNFCLLDNAYLIHMLANYGTSSSSDGLKEGGALRHKSSISVLDSVPFISPENIPDKKYWMNDYRKDKGLYMVEDNTSITLVHFLEKNLANNFVKDNDIEVLLGTSRSTNDAHIFDKKVIERDITCKNGYIHILDGVLIPPRNMSEYINLGTERIFADLLERYSAPFYSSTLTTDYKKIHPEFTDSIFVKTYYNKHENYNQKRYPDGSTVSTDRLLWFDPSWNSYSHYATGSTLYSDMAAIFLPTDNAMNTYLNGTGEGDGLFAGQILKEQYGSWENIPDNIITPLVNRHMHASFFNAIPSKFDKLIDSENTTFDVKIGDIEKAYIGTNGVV